MIIATSTHISIARVSNLEDKILSKYNKWEMAIKHPEKTANVFSFFYNNPHWPLFEESVKVAEKNIDKASLSDSMLMRWFKRYSPRTSHGLLEYANRLKKIDSEFAERYIKQTWIFQNLSPKFMEKYREYFENYVSPVDDAKKTKRLMKEIELDQLKTLKGIVIDEISDYITAFLEKHFMSKSGGFSKNDLQDIDKKYEIVQNLIDSKEDEKAANILTLSNLNEDQHSTLFFNQRRHIAFNLLRSGKPKLAYQVMSMYLLSDKKSEKISRAEWLLGYISFRFLKENKKAIQHFKKAFDNSQNPIRISKNAFWLAEVYRAEKDIILAMNWYRKASKYFSTFYGYIAQYVLRNFQKNNKLLLSLYKDYLDNSLLESIFVFYNRELVQVLSKVKNSKFRKLFYQSLIDEIEDPNEEMLLMDLAMAHDEISILISENSKRQRYFYNDKAYKILNKSELRIIKKINSDACFVSFVHSIIHRESNFNERAKSPVGAIGLMQIMPSTAKHEAKRIKLKFNKKNGLYNRNNNITIGSSLLNRLIKKYKGNMIYAAAAYNCGEGGVSKYTNSIKNLKELSQIDLIELIPIKETRIYVKHVIRSMFSYQKKFHTEECYNCNDLLKSFINK